MTPSNNLELQLPRGEADLLLLVVKVGEEKVEGVGETFKESGEGGGVNNCLFVCLLCEQSYFFMQKIFVLPVFFDLINL